MLEDRRVIDSPSSDSVILLQTSDVYRKLSYMCQQVHIFSPGSNPIFSTVVIVSLQYPYHGWHVLRFFWMRNKTYLAEQLPSSMQARLFITFGTMQRAG